MTREEKAGIGPQPGFGWPVLCRTEGGNPTLAGSLWASVFCGLNPWCPSPPRGRDHTVTRCHHRDTAMEQALCSPPMTTSSSSHPPRPLQHFSLDLSFQPQKGTLLASVIPALPSGHMSLALPALPSLALTS